MKISHGKRTPQKFGNPCNVSFSSPFFIQTPLIFRNFFRLSTTHLCYIRLHIRVLNNMHRCCNIVWQCADYLTTCLTCQFLFLFTHILLHFTAFMPLQRKTEMMRRKKLRTHKYTNARAARDS